MTTLKYDVSKVEGGGNHPQPGILNATIVSATQRETKADGSAANDIDLVVNVGKEYAHLHTYIGLSSEALWKLRELTDALGLPTKGNLDLAKLKGKKMKVKINPDSYEGTYRARVGKFMKLTDEDGDDPAEDPEPADDPAPGDAGGAEASADADDDYDDVATWPLEDLYAEAADKGIELKGRKTREKAIEALRALAGDGDEPATDGDTEPPADDYDEWPMNELQDEVNDRNKTGAEIKIAGRASKEKLIAALREDNAKSADSDGDLFSD